MATYILKKAGELVLVTAAAWLAGKMYDKGYAAAKAKYEERKAASQAASQATFKDKLAEVKAN